MNRKDNIKSGDHIIATLSTNSINPFEVDDYFYSQSEYKDLLKQVWYDNIKTHIIYWDTKDWWIEESQYSPCYIIEAEKI